MSKLNEYGWAVKPSMPGHWHGTTSAGEFEISITAAGIEGRAEADSNQEAQRERAAAVVENLVRAIGLREHERYTTRFASLSQFNPATNSRNVNVHPEGVPAKARVGSMDALGTDTDGRVISDSREQRRADALSLAALAAKDAALRRMIDFRLAYYDDPQRNLDHLLNIVEQAETKFKHAHRAEDALGLARGTVKKARDIGNDKEIKTSRHPGGSLGAQRDPTMEQTQFCEKTADAIIVAYAKYVRQEHPN